MFTLCDTFSSVAPIISAIDMYKLLKISRRMGSHCVPTAALRSLGRSLVSASEPSVESTASQSGSTITVEFGSTMMAGPNTASPGAMSSRKYTPVSTSPPSMYDWTFSAG